MPILEEEGRTLPDSGITVSCRIKEASKIAALNYILADERHANNGCCKHSLHEETWHEWSYSLQWGWGPHRGDPTGVARAAPAGSGDDGDAGEPVLATVRQRKACTPAAKVVSGTEADMMFRC